MAWRLPFLVLAAAALAAEEVAYRLLVAPRGSEAQPWMWAAPWAPLVAVALWHGARAPRLRALWPSAALGALALLVVQVLFALAGGDGADARLLRARPVAWALLSVPLWLALLGLPLCAGYGLRRLTRGAPPARGK